MEFSRCRAKDPHNDQSVGIEFRQGDLVSISNTISAAAQRNKRPAKVSYGPYEKTAAESLGGCDGGEHIDGTHLGDRYRMFLRRRFAEMSARQPKPAAKPEAKIAAATTETSIMICLQSFNLLLNRLTRRKRELQLHRFVDYSTYWPIKLLCNFGRRIFF